MLHASCYRYCLPEVNGIVERAGAIPGRFCHHGINEPEPYNSVPAEYAPIMDLFGAVVR
jgi:hypothetical protein